MKIHAWGGSVYDVGHLLSEGSTAAHLRKTLVELSRIPYEDQILLLYTLQDKSSPLDVRKPLHTYGLPSDDKTIFLFDRRLLASDAVCPSATSRYQPPAAAEVPDTITTEIQGLSQSSNPLLNALAAYGKLPVFQRPIVIVVLQISSSK